MGQTIKLPAVGAVDFMVLDGVWPGLLMKNFYREPAAVVYVGALFGLVVYGVYDFINFSTLRQWPLVLTLSDAALGTLSSAAAAVAVRIVAR